MEERYNLWLDDLRYPPRTTSSTYQWMWARTVEELVEIIVENGQPYALSLDFDLDELDYKYGLNGMSALQWILENDMWPTDYISVHSANPVGTERMYNFIEVFAPDDIKVLHYRALFERNGRITDEYGDTDSTS